MTANDALAEITAGAALAAVASGALFLDVREQDEWDRGHSPAATLLPMSRLRDGIDELPKDAPILVVCHSGRRSASVVAALRGAGYNAVNVVGGMLAIVDAGGEIVADGADAPRVD